MAGISQTLTGRKCRGGRSLRTSHLLKCLAEGDSPCGLLRMDWRTLQELWSILQSSHLHFSRFGIDTPQGNLDNCYLMEGEGMAILFRNLSNIHQAFSSLACSLFRVLVGEECLGHLWSRGRFQEVFQATLFLASYWIRKLLYPREDDQSKSLKPSSCDQRISQSPPSSSTPSYSTSNSDTQSPSPHWASK